MLKLISLSILVKLNKSGFIMMIFHQKRSLNCAMILAAILILIVATPLSGRASEESLRRTQLFDATYASCRGIAGLLRSQINDDGSIAPSMQLSEALTGGGFSNPLLLSPLNRFLFFQAFKAGFLDFEYLSFYSMDRILKSSEYQSALENCFPQDQVLKEQFTLYVVNSDITGRFAALVLQFVSFDGAKQLIASSILKITRSAQWVQRFENVLNKLFLMGAMVFLAEEIVEIREANEILSGQLHFADTIKDIVDRNQDQSIEIVGDALIAKLEKKLSQNPNNEALRLRLNEIKQQWAEAKK